MNVLYLGCPEAGVHLTSKLKSLFKDEYLESLFESVSQLLLEYFIIYVKFGYEGRTDNASHPRHTFDGHPL